MQHHGLPWWSAGKESACGMLETQVRSLLEDPLESKGYSSPAPDPENQWTTVQLGPKS